jgi:hypothetical protein
MHHVHIIFKDKNQAENIGTSLIPTLTVTTEIWAVVCKGWHLTKNIRKDNSRTTYELLCTKQLIIF